VDHHRKAIASRGAVICSWIEVFTIKTAFAWVSRRAGGHFHFLRSCTTSRSNSLIMPPATRWPPGRSA